MKAMKTLILYATKSGAAREIAQRIASRMEGAAVHDLKQGAIPPLADYDCIIVGSSIYAGAMRKEAKAFMAQNMGAIEGKKLGLFLSGMDKSGGKDYFQPNFSPEALQMAKATGFLGGIFDPQKAGFMGRLVMRIITKQSGYIDAIDDEKIEQFVEAIKA
jgi:menaquinone-dependent protoporphyrinogen oxidase